MTLDAVHEAAEAHEIPILDALMIAANAAGADSILDYPRARMQLQPNGSDEAWQVILPLENPRSPFRLDETELSLDGEPVAALVGIDNDDVVLTYLRAGGRSLTLNSHSRSACIGCMFCPNILEEAADENVDGVGEMLRLLEWVEADNGWDDLSGVEVITVCTGCFHTPEAARIHLSEVRQAASQRGFTGLIHLLSSVVRERRDLEWLAEEVGPFHLTLTFECFTRRNLILKDTKASLTLDDACRILDDCAELGILGDFTYVTGLDPFEDTVSGLRTLARHATTFPRIQVYQAHNAFMETARSPGAATLDYFLGVRKAVEPDLAAQGLAPVSWQNYRPLWYSTFNGEPVAGPRV